MLVYPVASPYGESRGGGRLAKQIAVEALCNGGVVRHESDDRGGCLRLVLPHSILVLR